jgi:RHS repeat-associated protein
VFSGHSNGRPEVMQVTDYYPFGLVMNQENYFASGVLSNKYLYNGKELQDDELAGNSLGWYDYGARMYDAELGRWHSVDPLSEWAFNMTPYRYAFNNPIRYIDPDGMFESRREARRYRRENDVEGRIRRNDDGSYSIDNKKAGTSIWNDSEFGISIGALALGNEGGSKSSEPSRIFMQDGGYSGTGNGGESIGKGYRARHNYGTLDHSYFNPRFMFYYIFHWLRQKDIENNNDFSQKNDNQSTSDKKVNPENKTNKSGEQIDNNGDSIIVRVTRWK